MLVIVPVTFRQACAFIDKYHRHHKAPRGMKFCIGVTCDGELVGVVTAGRPVARALDDGLTIEVNRTCTDGTRNANSMLYGAAWRCARAMGYTRSYSYTEDTETGESLRAAGYVLDAVLDARGNWADSSVKLRRIRDAESRGYITRMRWKIEAT